MPHVTIGEAHRSQHPALPIRQGRLASLGCSTPPRVASLPLGSSSPSVAGTWSGSWKRSSAPWGDTGVWSPPVSAGSVSTVWGGHFPRHLLSERRAGLGLGPCGFLFLCVFCSEPAPRPHTVKEAGALSRVWSRPPAWAKREPHAVCPSSSVATQTAAHLETALPVHSSDHMGTRRELVTPQKTFSAGFCRSAISF